MRDDIFAQGIEYEDNRNRGGDSMFLWTVFLLLLTGCAIAAWIGSYYIFGQPERPFSYDLLKKLKKVEPPKKFEITAAPSGEFLSPVTFYERFGSLNQYDLEQFNIQLVRNFIKNYEQNKPPVPYLFGTFTVQKTQKLDDNALFSSGLAAFAESNDEPRLFIEYIYSAEPSEADKIAKAVRPGNPIVLEKTQQLCAVVHLERLPDRRLVATVMPLHYGMGTATNKGDIAGFVLRPPLDINLRAGWPIMKTAFNDEIKKYEKATAIAAATPTPKTTPPVRTSPTPAVIAAATPAQVFTPLPAATPLPASTPVAVATPLPMSTPTALATPGRTGTPHARTTPTIAAATPVPLATPTAPRATPATTPPIAVAAVTPLPTPAAGMTPSIPANSDSVPVLRAEPNVSPGATVSPGVAVSTPEPLATPPATTRELNADEAANLAGRDLGAERLFLTGSFVVTASNNNRAIMRVRNMFGAKGNARIIVDFPPGRVPPREGAVIDRPSQNGFQVWNVTRTPNGDVNIYVRETAN